MSESITFHPNGYSYNEAVLRSMPDEKLLELRNLVASNLGVSAVKGFKDHDTAVAQTWKALVKYNESNVDEAAGGKEKPVKPAKLPKEPKERKTAKPAEPQYVKRPTRKMFSEVKIIKEHTGAEGRAHRWPNYKDGMLVIDAIEGVGTIPWDIYNWESKGLMQIVEPNDEQYEQRRADWYKRHGLTDPDLDKETKAADREKLKAERAAAAAQKKADKEAAKAAKAAEKAAVEKAAE